MKKYILFIVTLIFLFNFSGCAKSNQEILNEKHTEEMSDLINDLMEKEKKINDLTKKLESCEKLNREENN